MKRGQGVWFQCFFVFSRTYQVSSSTFLTLNDSDIYFCYSSLLQITRTVFKTSWLLLYWDLLFVGHVQPLARTLTYCKYKYSHGCILTHTTIATHAIFNCYRFPWSFSCAYNLQQLLWESSFVIVPCSSQEFDVHPAKLDHDRPPRKALWR